nr:NADH dehydrogenase subunit 2 [Scelimena sp. 1 JL-2023a]
MKKSPLKMMFTTTLILSTLISVTASSWLGLWLGMEVNLLSFIPMMSADPQKNLEMSGMKYFIVQTIGSISLIMTFITSMVNNFDQMNTIVSTMMTLTLTLKMGGAPMHFWLPEVMENLSWENCAILMTWQKIAPMCAMAYIKSNELMMLIVIMSSAMVGAIMGLNQISLRMLMAYSSINHVGWMLAAIKTNLNVWYAYIMIYSMLTTLISLMFKSTNTKMMNELFMSQNNNKMNKFTLIMSLMNLGGMPPMIGFLPKWILMQELAAQSCMIMLMTLILSSSITLYFYMKMFFSGSIINFKETKWNINNKKLTNPQKILQWVNIMSLTGLTMTLLFMQ